MYLLTLPFVCTTPYTNIYYRMTKSLLLPSGTKKMLAT